MSAARIHAMPTKSHSACILYGHRASYFLSLPTVSSIVALLAFMQIALVGPASAQNCQYSPYWGKNGELWNPNGPLKDYSHVGYHGGNDPIPYQKRAASKSFGAGRFTITDRMIITNGVLRGAGKDKTTLYFPKGLVGMGYPCPGGGCWDWSGAVIEATGTEIGIEDLTIEFPPHSYQHANGQGFNGIMLRGCRDCWVKNVRILNADEGIGIFNDDATHTGTPEYGHNTVEDVEVLGGNHVHIHMSTTLDNLVRNFTVSGGTWHGLVGNWDTHGGVYANGVANPLTLEPNHAGPTTTGMLYSNIQGANRRVNGGNSGSTSDMYLWNVAPDHGLCPLEIYQAQLAIRLGDSPPIADAGLDQGVNVGDLVTLDGRRSSDPDGDALTFSWNFGDGTTATGAVVSHTYAMPGTYTAALTVSDGKLAGTDTSLINVQWSASDVMLLVNVGGGKYTDSAGYQWAADQPYSPGSWGYVGGSTYHTNNPIANTADDPLYQYERHGTFSYKFDVPTGWYDVNLDFAELYWNGSGQRLFDVFIQGKLVLDNYDIYKTAGRDSAISLTFPGILVQDGHLTIDFVTVKDNAKVSAIQIQSSANPGPDPSPDVMLLVNVGGGKYTDSAGYQWAADQPYSPGSWGYVGGSTYHTNNPIANTADDPLYQYERHGTFSYKFDVPTGWYDVNLDFAELYWNGSGQRLFDVFIQGKLVLDNYDIYKTAGRDSAISLTFPGILVQDGHLTIDFVTVKDNAKVSAIQIQSSAD